MSEFVYLFRIGAAAQREAMGTPEHAQQSMRVWRDWMGELEAKGHLKNPGQPLEPTGKTVRGKQKAVTDGPYVEVKDLVAGFTIIEARDLAQAVDLAKGCPILDGQGSVEVRPIMKSAM
ncbi:MAG: transcription initiation protein [Acidobacteria bacterium]|nr:transcription initiation protein [Acidobacteriota bacterium]